jgi:hypothetical protein
MSKTRTSSLVLGLGLVLLSVPAAAQTWTGGLTAGATLSSLSADDRTDLHPIWGGVGGAFVTGNLNGNLGVQIEALISQRGAKNDATGATLRLTYLDVPLLFRFGSSVTSHRHLHAFAGVAPGFKLNAALSDGATHLSTGITGDITSFDLGIPIGLELGSGTWAVDARYTFGLLNVNDSGSDIQNNAAAFKIVYRIR